MVFYTSDVMISLDVVVQNLDPNLRSD